MNSKKRKQELEQHSSSKRFKSDPIFTIGAPTPDDDLRAPVIHIKTGADSTRILPAAALSSLLNLTSKVFAANFRHLCATHQLDTESLRALPDHLFLRIWAKLIEYCPTFLSHGFIVAVRFAVH